MSRLATLTATALTAGALAAGALAAAPGASAQNNLPANLPANYLELASPQNIASLDCDTVEKGLDRFELADDTTTHAELIRKINGVIGDDFILRAAASASVKAAADRALECELVEPTPAGQPGANTNPSGPSSTLPTSLSSGSSNFSFTQLVTRLTTLSS